MLPITSVFAALIAFLFLFLSARVITYRRGNLISLGDQGDKALETRMRAHGNCAEYAPLGLILMALVELQFPNSSALHGIGGLLLVGRVLHGYGFSASPPIMRLRQIGMILTLGSYLVSIFLLIYLPFAPF